MSANYRILENLGKNRIKNLPIVPLCEEDTIGDHYHFSVLFINIYFCNKWLFLFAIYVNSAVDFESCFRFLNLVITGNPNERVRVGWNCNFKCCYECSLVFWGRAVWVWPHQRLLCGSRSLQLWDCAKSPHSSSVQNLSVCHGMTEHCSPLASCTLIMSREIRMYVIKLASLTVENKGDSVLWLELLADYSGKKKKNFRSLPYTLH